MMEPTLHRGALGVRGRRGDNVQSAVRVHTPVGYVAKVSGGSWENGLELEVHDFRLERHVQRGHATQVGAHRGWGTKLSNEWEGMDQQRR